MLEIKNHLRTIQLISTGLYPCGYMDGLQARSQLVVPHSTMNTRVYAELLEKGFRRSGLQTYRPRCDNCHACMSLRVVVPQFMPNRSQRRAWQQHRHLQAHILPMQFRSEHYALYQAYQQARHADGDMAHHSTEEYSDFIVNSPVQSMLVEFRDMHDIKIVAVVDVLPDAISAVYTFYANDAHATYGTYAILWQIEWARQNSKKHVYLGYWIANNRKMHYKIRFHPAEIWVNNEWRLWLPSDFQV